MRRIAFGVLLLLFAGCHSTTPDEQLVKSTDKAAAWIPSLRMIGEKWLSNSVPASFVDNATAAAEKEFETAIEEIAKAEASPALERRLRDDIEAGRRFNQALRVALDRDEPRLIVPALKSLDAPQRDLEQIRKQHEGSP